VYAMRYLHEMDTKRSIGIGSDLLPFKPLAVQACELSACVSVLERFPSNLAHGRRSILLFEQVNWPRWVMQPVRSLL
jgi:hypothetical protein